MTLVIQEKLDLADYRELDAVITISSAKPGNGVEQLRDPNLETYWQSDGFTPHSMNIQFCKKTSLAKLCLYIDYNLDESYTPKKISILSGTNLHDLLEIATLELQDPSGWVVISFGSLTESLDNGTASAVPVIEGCIRIHFLQVRVLSMHQNGRDTHIRQLKLLGPRASPPTYPFEFKTVEMLQHTGIR